MALLPFIFCTYPRRTKFLLSNGDLSISQLYRLLTQNVIFASQPAMLCNLRFFPWHICTLSPSNYQLWTFNASLTSIKYQKCDFIFANVRIQYNIFDCIHIHLVKSVCMYQQNHHHHHHHCICFKCLFSLLAWVE